jgi:hypothetical protein
MYRKIDFIAVLHFTVTVGSSIVSLTHDLTYNIVNYSFDKYCLKFITMKPSVTAQCISINIFFLIKQ